MPPLTGRVGGWLPCLGEIDFPPLSGAGLLFVVQHKQSSAGMASDGRISRLFLSPGLAGWPLFSPGLSWMAFGRMGYLMRTLP